MIPIDCSKVTFITGIYVSQRELIIGLKTIIFKKILNDKDLVSK